MNQYPLKNISMKTRIAGILLCICMIAVGYLSMKNEPQTTAGEKRIGVMVVYSETKDDFFYYETDAEYLGEVLLENALVEGNESQYGLFITTVNGVTADEGRQEWWCLTKGGEQLNTGIDTTPIADGDTFELTLTEGY